MQKTWTEASVVCVIREEFVDLLSPGARHLLDDAAWLPQTPKGSTRVISCDAFSEGCDFLLQIAPVETSGYRAIVQNLSDLAAMGATPVGFVWSLEISRKWLKNEAELLKRFCRGAAKACREYGLSFFGGDLSLASDKFNCTVTILGDVAGVPLSRSGAKPGDQICVSHLLGPSSFGLEIMLKTLKSKRSVMSDEDFQRFLQTLSQGEQSAVAAHVSPIAEIELGRFLVGKASACMDISDGLARDLHRLCGASKVGALINNLDDALVPSLPNEIAKKYALTGGEDFALLFTVAKTMQVPENCIKIGVVTEEVGVVKEGQGDDTSPIQSAGYDHFESRA